eukprot:SAG25_NODE_13609_length_265_cov_0.626506_2_plen_26_part_01
MRQRAGAWSRTDHEKEHYDLTVSAAS